MSEGRIGTVDSATQALIQILGTDPNNVLVQQEVIKALSQETLAPSTTAISATTGVQPQIGQALAPAAVTSPAVTPPAPIQQVQQGQVPAAALAGPAPVQQAVAPQQATEPLPVIEPIAPLLERTLAPVAEQEVTEQQPFSIVEALGDVTRGTVQAIKHPLKTAETVIDKAVTGFSKGAQAVGTDPVLQDQLAQIAGALASQSPSAFGPTLARELSEQAQGQQAAQLTQATLDQLAGREPSIDPNRLTLSPEQRIHAEQSAFAQVSTAAQTEDVLSRTPSVRQKQLDQQLTVAQIGATNALTQQRNLETLTALQGAGVVDLKPQHFQVLNEIGELANLDAVADAGSGSKIIIGPDGNATYQFENPTAYRKTYNAVRSNKINQAIEDGILPESIRQTVTATGATPPAPPISNADNNIPESSTSANTAPPGSRYVGAFIRGNTTFYYYIDSEGIARAVQEVTR